MPIDFNHMDYVEWPLEEQSKEIFDLALKAIFSVKVFNDEELSTIYGTYKIGIRKDNVDSTYIIQDTQSDAWIIIHTAFQELIKRFQKDTRKPISPDNLPQ